MTSLSVNIYRANQVESCHRVHAIISDKGQGQHKGKTIYGNHNYSLFTRSVIKPFQAAVSFELDTFQKMKISPTELALACASHHGESFHIQTVKSWLNRIKLSETNLVCASHEPYNKKAFEHLLTTSEKPTRLHNNCSGKHSLMLSTCVFKNWPLDYEHYNHPLQIEIRKKLTQWSNYDFETTDWATDGCGIPTYFIPLHVLATLCEELIEPKKMNYQFVDLFWKSILAHPEMISGTDGICTKILKITEGNVFAKVGAEGVYIAVDKKRKISISLKVEDGASRASEYAVCKLLYHTGSLTEDQFKMLQPGIIKNWEGKSVGHIDMKIP
jgi:L-asparaginase II